MEGAIVFDDWILLLLRVTHVLAGVLWAGTVVLIAGFIEPVARSLGPDGGRFMQGLTRGRHLPTYLTVASLLTVGSGLALYWRASGGLHWAWVQSGPGITFAIGGLVAIAAWLLGHFVNSPTAKRIGVVAESIQKGGGPPSPDQMGELSLLQARLRLAVRVGAVALTLSTVTMAVARYT
jgi:hypothetical protein